MFKLSERKELLIAKDRSSITVKSRRCLLVEEVSLPVVCFQRVLDCMKEIDEDVLPRLTQGLKINYIQNVGHQWALCARTAFQCIFMRPSNWKSDSRRIYFIVGLEWEALHTTLPLILDELQKTPPKFQLYPPVVYEADECNIPGLDGEW
jgi:hypothetical protein